MKMTNIVLVAAVLAAPMPVLAVVAAPDTLWVDRTYGDDDYEGDDKGDEYHPYASIQAAVEDAKDGDTIKVLPGDYDNGGYVDSNGHSNRVYIAKKIHLVSTDGAWQTTIRGKFDSGDTANNGTNLAGDGVRCVYFNNASNKGYGAVVEGFTLVDGYAAGAHGHGGAIRTTDVNVGAYFVDCVITNCTGTKVSANANAVVRGGTLVRCEVRDSVAWATLYTAKAWNCVFSGNSGVRGVLASSTAVNCSFFGNDNMDYLSFQECKLFNCAATCYPKLAKHQNSGTIILNSTDDRAGVFVDAANGDWTLTPGSSAIGIADAAALTNVIKLTDAEFPIDLLDFYWDPLPTEGTINAGAVQDVRSAVTWWVDRTRGDDDYAGLDVGDTNHPFASIQAAVDAADVGDTIKVLPGDYDNGGYIDGYGHTNRVYIAKRLHLVSTGGAAVTTIRGRHDTGDTALSGSNLAGDGVRCAYAPVGTTVNGRNYYNAHAYGSVIEGFTLADGYAAKTHGYCGAFLSADLSTVFLVDCVITNCTGTSDSASSNGVIKGGVLARCAVVDSPNTWSIVVCARAWNSVFRGNTAIRAVFARSKAANCSLMDNDCSYICFGAADGDGEIYGIVSEGARPAAWTNSEITNVNSLKGLSSAFVDGAGGDWRLLPGSAAIGLADAADCTNVVDFSLATAPIAFTDFHGNEMPTDGAINAGAAQVVAPSMYIASPEFGGATVTGCALLDTTNFIPRSGAADIEIEINPSTALRSLSAVVTNGVAVPIAAAPAAFTITPSVDSGAFTSVEWIYSPNWYVNEKTGSDSNNGFSPETPFATLAMACTNVMLASGDVIHVAEGVYTNGVVAPASGKTIGARAYVKSGVTLVADGAKEKTLIVGAEATGDNIEETTYKTGFYAVRGVFLETGATVRGFTICGGRTRGIYNAAGASMSNPDFNGAGVCGASNTGADHLKSIAEDCVFSNNVATWGGAASSACLVRCLVRFNGATRMGGSTAYCSHESCYVADHVKGSMELSYPYGILNTTIYMPGAAGGAVQNEQRVPTNSLFLAKVNPSQWMINAVNCVFQKHTSTGRILLPSDLPPGSTSTFADSIAALNLDSGYRPSRASMVVDFSPQLGVLTSDKDLDGNPRVLNNGRVDCGCYEYDWRKDYAADIGAKNLSVDAASPDVVETNGVVRLVGGCELVMSWTLRAAGRCTFPVVVSGAGTLSAYVNGALVATLTEGDEGFAWEGQPGVYEIRLAFSGDGYAELGTPKNASGTVIIIR